METATAICKALAGQLEGREYAGTVAELGSGFVLIETAFGYIRLSSDLSTAPFTVSVSGTQPFPAYGILFGSDVYVSREVLDFPETELVIDLKLAEEKELSLFRASNLFIPTDFPARLRCLRRVMDAGIYMPELSPGDAKTAKRLMALRSAAVDEEEPALRAAAADIAGIGQGLLPASDRLLCGFLCAYTAFGLALGRTADKMLRVTRCLAEAACENTSRYAAFCLRLAAEGLAKEEELQLMRCLFSDRSHTALSSACGKAAQEGSDWLTGVMTLLS